MKPIRKSLTAAVLAALGATALLVPVFSTMVRAEDKVLANVNGRPITQQMLDIAIADISTELQGLTPEQQRGATMQYLIQVTLLADAANKEGIEGTPDYERRLDYFKLRALRDSFFDKKVVSSLNDAEAMKLYNERIANLPEDNQMRARHILLKTEEDAQDALERLRRGDEFEDLAKELSTGPTGPRGGDLGFFSKGDMVAEFEEVALKLAPGEVSEPVQTKFGWHIIRLEERRKFQPFEEVKDQIKGELVYHKAREVITGLEKSATIEIVDADIKQAIAASARGSFGQ